MRSPYDSIGAAMSVCSFIAASRSASSFASRAKSMIAFAAERRRKAAAGRSETPFPDAFARRGTDCARGTRGSARTASAVGADASHADHVQLARRRVVEIDHGGAADRLGDAARRLVEVVERRLDGHRFEAEVRETFGAAAAPRLALRVLPLVGDVARENDRTDDAPLVVADRRGLQIDDAVVVRCADRARGSPTSRLRRAGRASTAARSVDERASIDVAMPAVPQTPLGIRREERTPARAAPRHSSAPAAPRAS